MSNNENALKIIDILESRGYEAFIVGGSVRDLILGEIPKNWDITTNAIPEQMLAVFKDYHTIPTGLKHGTITVVRFFLPEYKWACPFDVC